MSTDTDVRSEAEPPTSPLPKPPTRDDRIRLVAALVGLGAAALFLIATVAVVNQDDKGSKTTDSADDDGWGGVAISPTRDRPDFTLTDTEGQPFNFAEETQGRLTLLFFGYTHCPDICPVQMANIDAALEMPGTPEATVVFVTTDPERDTPERLNEWLGGFSSKFIGLSGTHEEIAAAETAAGAANSAKDPKGDDEDYVVGHSASVIAYTPDDEAHVEYPSGVRQEDYAGDLPRMIDRWGKP